MSAIESGISFEDFRRLFEALEFNDKDILMACLGNEVVIYNLLGAAISQGNVEFFKYLRAVASNYSRELNGDFVLNLCRLNSHGESLLGLALRSGDIEFFEALINGSVLTRDCLALSFIESVLRLGNVKILEAFLRAASDFKQQIYLSHRNLDGESLISLALRTGDIEFFDALIYHESVSFSAECLTPELFESVVLMGDIGILKYFLSAVTARVKQKVDLNHQNEEGATLLDLAYQNNFEDIAEFLKANGAKSSTVGNGDRFPHECAPQEDDVTDALVVVDHPRPITEEDEPQAKRQRTDSGEEIQGGEDQESKGQDSIFAPTNARKSWNRKKGQ